mgnify:CR=1 FL=1
MKDTFILIKNNVDRPYVYKKGEDPNVPYAIVDYGDKFNDHGKEVELEEARWAPIKMTKYLTIGDRVLINNYIKGTIKTEKLIDEEFDAITWEDEFLITDVFDPLKEEKLDDTIKLRKEIVSDQEIIAILRCPNCGR